MKFHHIRSFLNKRYVHPVFQKIHIFRILRSIDFDGFSKIKEKYENTPTGKKKAKYLNLQKCVRIALGQIHELNLHTSAKLNILDIGTGSGYFPYVCKYFGHSATGTERAAEDFVLKGTLNLDPLNSMYMETNQLLGIKRIPWTIRGFEPAPEFDQKFDLITAFAVMFDRKGDSGYRWDEKEWEFFIRDIVHNLLTDEGKIYIRLNLHYKHHHKKIQENDEFLKRACKYFISTGAEIRNNIVYYKSIRQIRTAL